MKDPIKRTETTHIDEVKRTSLSTAQWLLENKNTAGTHPISHNNRLTFFIGGQDAFADIAKSINNAKESIDICCWGFDPGMELIRNRGSNWPRGDTYGDLLIAAGKRGVKVRMLIWYDEYAVRSPKNPRNMPGHTHDVDSRRRNYHPSRRPTNAFRSVSAASVDLNGKYRTDIDANGIAALARRNYCMDWYDAAFGESLEKLPNIEIRKRRGDADAISQSLAGERDQPSDLSSYSVERQGMVRFGTLHQKPILIDFFHDEGRSAVGYIMGLNSLSDYWDTAEHKLDDPNREYEYVVGVKPTPGCRYVKPMRDYACRIDGGRALLAIYHNFIKAWGAGAQYEPIAGPNGEKRRPSMPEACMRKARPGDSTVQIVRTEPADSDKSIKEVYFQATDQAAAEAGYIYLENQYFQYKEWAERLMKKRKNVMEEWTAVCGSSCKTDRDMPILHVFIVIPVPEREGMIPRTYDTLATLGQQEAMKGQCQLIREKNEEKPITVMAGIGQPMKITKELPEVVRDANRIKKPDEKMLETSYGLRVCTAMLNACDSINGTSRYREIYIHSKLMLIGDTFLTLGSANLNQRSMAVDSEINLAAIAPDKVIELRRRIWSQLGGSACDGGSGSREEIASAFKRWQRLVHENGKAKKLGQPISGYLLPLGDERNSLVREG